MEKKSPHILNASSGLLGFCLVILTSLEITAISDGTFIDEIAGIASLLLAISCMMSFMSIRTKSEIREKSYEKIADYMFMAALFCIGISVTIVTFDIF